MAHTENHSTHIHLRVADWIDDNYPTAIYHYIYGCSWATVALGVVLTLLSYWSHSAYDLIVGLSVTIIGTAISTVLSLWARNQIGTLRDRARREHPSYPYKIK